MKTAQKQQYYQTKYTQWGTLACVVFITHKIPPGTLAYQTEMVNMDIISSVIQQLVGTDTRKVWAHWWYKLVLSTAVPA